jgi:hypothetical protein
MKALAPSIAAALLAGGLATPALAVQVEANAHAESVIGDIIDGLVGHRYGVNDRQAIRRCGWAAVQRAENQYRRDFTGRPVAYPGYRGYVRVAAITDVQRRFGGMVRVRGLLDTPRFGYGRGSRAADLVFRCDVDRRGRVQNVRVDANPHRWPR